MYSIKKKNSELYFDRYQVFSIKSPITRQYKNKHGANLSLKSLENDLKDIPAYEEIIKKQGVFSIDELEIVLYES